MTISLPQNIQDGDEFHAAPVMANFAALVNGINSITTSPTFLGTVNCAGLFRHIKTPDTGWSDTFGSPTSVVASDSTASANFVGYAVNNSPPSTAVLPVGNIGYGVVAPGAVGNIVYGIYGLSDLRASAGVGVAGEFTARNFTGTPDTNFPPNQGFGTSTRVSNGVHVTSGGPSDSSIGVQIGSNGDPGFFNTALYAREYRQYGLYIAEQTAGVQSSAVIRNRGAGPNLLLQTTGAITPANNVIGVQDNGSVFRFTVKQNGDTAVNSMSLTARTAPATPPAGTAALYMDVADGNVKIILPSGTIKALTP